MAIEIDDPKVEDESESLVQLRAHIRRRHRGSCLHRGEVHLADRVGAASALQIDELSAKKQRSIVEAGYLLVELRDEQSVK